MKDTTRHPWRDYGKPRVIGAWSKEDHQRLVELAGTIPPAEIAATLGRSLSAIKNRARIYNLSLAIVLFHKPWTTKEIRFLRKSAGVLTLGEVAAELNRTYASVKLKAAALGLDYKRYGERNCTRYSGEDVELCRQLHDEGLSRSEIAEKMEVPYQRVCEWVSMRSRWNE